MELEDFLVSDVGRIGLFRRLHRAHLGRKILHTVHDIAHNPFVKAVAGGLTFVIPPAGLALSAGLIAADKGTEAIDNARHHAAAALASLPHARGASHPPVPVTHPLATAHAALPAAVPPKPPMTTRVVVREEPAQPGIHAVGDTGVAIAERMVSAHMHGDAKVKAAVAGIFKRTAELAKTGDADAKRALVVLAAAKKKLSALQHFTYHVDGKGRVTRGSFKRLPKGQRGLDGYYVRADGHVEHGTFAHA